MVLSMAPLRAGFLEYEQTNALDLIGPAEAFASAFRDNGRVKFERCYEVLKYRPDAAIFRRGVRLRLPELSDHPLNSQAA
jgi:hypothetical protein